MKLLFAASSGGHYEQLMMLKPLMEKYDSIIVTERTKYLINNSSEKMNKDNGNAKSPQLYYMHQINRKELLFIPKYIGNLVRALRIFIKEKPDVMITTGVLAIVPLAHVMKLFGRKLVFIESFAKTSSKTLTGKALYKHADRFYVQWPQMLEEYPNAIYKGGIY